MTEDYVVIGEHFVAMDEFDVEEIESGCVSLLTPDDDSDFSYLFGVDEMVKRIRRYHQSGLEMRSGGYGRMDVEWLLLSAKHYNRLGEYISRYSPDSFYSPNVWAFYEGCKAVGILGDRYFVSRAPNEYYGSTGKVYAELFNELIEKVREVCQSRDFKERERYLRNKSKRNERRGLELERKMFEWKSRHLILVLTFGYKPEHCREITEEDIRRHRNQFFNNRRNNKLLNGIVGYIWAIERGKKSGLHLHLILFYSNERRKDVVISAMIGEYWVNEVTEGKGLYWNSNADKEGHEKRGYGDGTGCINRGETEKRDALRKTIRYLSKTDDQLLLAIGEKHFRTFDVSQVPEKVKSGRPRIDASSGKVSDARIEDERLAAELGACGTAHDVAWNE